jgi:predicted GNAT family acetyltransferase
MGTIFARIFESRLSRTGPAVVSELRRMGCARALRERGVPGVRRSGDLLLRAFINGFFLKRSKIAPFCSIG